MNVATARSVLAKNSKSFALAGRLLPARCLDDAAVLYAWCRRADDAIDNASHDTAAAQLSVLRRELASVYEGLPQSDDTLREFQHLVRRLDIPRSQPEALLDGFSTDIGIVRFDTLDELILYAYRVAGVVGLMMCPVLGVHNRAAWSRATHLGIAMQLTNICRDIAEDWERQRLYVPGEILARFGLADLGLRLGGPIPVAARIPLRQAVGRVLDLADEYYRSGDIGLQFLRPRVAVAIRSASKIYSSIGTVLRRADCDALRGRAVVSNAEKIHLVLLAVLEETTARLRMALRSLGARVPIVRQFSPLVGIDATGEGLFNAI